MCATGVTGAVMFEWPVQVYYEDTDAGGVVYHANYLRFMERARTEWLRNLGYEQDVLLRDQGILFAVRHAAVDYLRPARFNQRLWVRSTLSALRGASLTFEHSIVAAEDERELCRATVKVACIDDRTQRPARIPPDMLAGLQSPAST